MIHFTDSTVNELARYAMYDLRDFTAIEVG